MKDYKLNERRCIDQAFARLRKALERDHKAETWLDEAYRYERKQRGSMPLTQALLISSFVEGYEREGMGNATAVRVYGYSDGCAKAYVLGATARVYADRFPVSPADLQLFRDAVGCDQDASQRRHEANMERLANA